MDSLPAEPQRNTTGHTDIHLKKKVEEEGHQVKSLGDSVYSHHEKRRKVHHESVHCVLGNSSILNCWVAMTLICMNRAGGAGEAVLFREAVQRGTEKARFCSQAAESASYTL